MGTHHVKLWANCLQTLDAIESSRHEVELQAASAEQLVRELSALEACPKATWKKLVLDMQVPLTLATAFVNVSEQDPDNSTVVNLSSQALCMFLRNADVDGCASGEAASSRIKQAMRQQLEQSGLLRTLPEVLTDTAADMTKAAQQAAAAAAAAGASSNTPTAPSSSSTSSMEYPEATVAHAEMLLLFVTLLLPWWPAGVHRQHMVASLAGPVCHMALASVHLVSNLLIGQQQPHPDVALRMQGLLHRALQVSATIYGFHRGCAPIHMDYQALIDNPTLLQVINSSHFLPSVALNGAVLALALMIKERQGVRQDDFAGAAALQGDAGAGNAAERSSGSSSGAAASSSAADGSISSSGAAAAGRSSGSGSSGGAAASSIASSGSSGAAAAASGSTAAGSSIGRRLTQLEVRAVRQRLNQLPPELPIEEYTAQAVSHFTDAVRLLPKLTRSHRKLFALLGVDPRVAVWAAVMFAQPSTPFQFGVITVAETLHDVATVFGQTMDLMLRPGTHIPPEKQAALWQQHLQLPEGQLQLERQLTLLMPLVGLHGAARLPTGRAACLQRMKTAARVGAQASLWWETYAEALPRVSDDPWLLQQLPVQWLSDMLPAVLKLGGKVVEGLTAGVAADVAAAERGGPARASSSAGTAETERKQQLVHALEATVAALGPILRRCMKLATEGVDESARAALLAAQIPPGWVALGLPDVPAESTTTLGLLRTCLAAAVDAFAVIEAFVRATATGVAKDFDQKLLEIGVFRLLFCAWDGTLPAVSLCCQAQDSGKSVRAFFSLATSCLKLLSTDSAPTARLCAGAAHVPFLLCRVAVTLLQDDHWPAALLQAAGIPKAQQGNAAGGAPLYHTWYDPASRLPTLVLFGRCCLLWAQELRESLRGLLAQLAAPQRAGSSSNRSSSSRRGPRSLSSLQMPSPTVPDFSAAWFFFDRVYKDAPNMPTWSHSQVLVDVIQNWITAHSEVIEAAGCDAMGLVQQLQQLLAARQTAADCTSEVAAAVEELVQQLLATGKVCCAVPLKTLCNNPVCGASQGPSELKLVGGGVGLCKGCLGVRYCSKACQNQHWKQHKPVCKALAQRKAAAAAAGASAAAQHPAT